MTLPDTHWFILCKGDTSRDETGERQGTDVADLIHFNKIRIYLKGKGKTLQGFQQGWHDQIYVLETAFSCSVEDRLEVGDLRKGFGNNCLRCCCWAGLHWWQRGRVQKVERTELGCLLFPLDLGCGGSLLFSSAASFQNWRAPHCVVLHQLNKRQMPQILIRCWWLREAETTEHPSTPEAAQAATTFSFQKQQESEGGQRQMPSGALGLPATTEFFLDH